MNILEIDVSYINNNDSNAINTFFIGITHSFLLSLPFSVPLLVCLRRLLVQGIPAGLFSYLGNAVAQTFFVSMLIFGFRDFIQFWYDWEPVLYLLGVILSFRILLTFFVDSRLKALNPSNVKPFLRIFLTSFVLVLLNPVSAITPSQMVLTQEILSFTNPLVYLFGFFLGVFGGSCFFGFLCYFLRNWLLAFSLRPYGSFMRPINKAIVLISLSFIITVTVKSSWQLFFHYPMENTMENIQRIENVLPVKVPSVNAIRQFPVFDSGVVVRDTPVKAYRHFPVDLLNARRFFRDLPPFTESQYEKVYYRFNVHIVNKLSDFITKQRFTARTPFIDQRTPEQIKRLKQVKQDYIGLVSDLSLDNSNSIQRNIKPRLVENKGKGKGIYGQEQRTIDNLPSNLYLHKDLKEFQGTLTNEAASNTILDAFDNPLQISR